MVALAVAQQTSSQASGLSAFDFQSFDGFAAIKFESDTYGTGDNGETVVLGVPGSLEGNGGVFSAYTLNLSGGAAATTIDTPVDIIINGSVFATTDNITSGEAEASVATKIFNACDAVSTSDYSFSKSGEVITVTSLKKEGEKIELDIGNTGFSYLFTDIKKVA